MPVRAGPRREGGRWVQTLKTHGSNPLERVEHAAEQLEEALGGAVQDRPPGGVRATELHHEPPVQQAAAFGHAQGLCRPRDTARPSAGVLGGPELEQVIERAEQILTIKADDEGKLKQVKRTGW